MLTTTLALTVGCPACFQPAGCSCRVIGNRHREPRPPHEARIRKAIAVARARAAEELTSSSDEHFRRVIYHQEAI